MQSPWQFQGDTNHCKVLGPNLCPPNLLQYPSIPSRGKEDLSENTVTDTAATEYPVTGTVATPALVTGTALNKGTNPCQYQLP